MNAGSCRWTPPPGGSRHAASSSIVGIPTMPASLPRAHVAATICAAEGQRGPCLAYLENTVRHLDDLGIPDRRLHALLDLVRTSKPPQL
jgi:cation transport protein ChaC